MNCLPLTLPSPAAERDCILQLSVFDELHAGRTPNINAGKEEQPDDVDEMPVPGRGLEAEMLLGAEVALERAEQADGQEYGPDDDMETVEASGHEEGRAIDIAAIVAIEGKGGMGIFIGLDRGEQQTEADGEGETPFQALRTLVRSACCAQVTVVPEGNRSRGLMSGR